MKKLIFLLTMVVFTFQAALLAEAPKKVKKQMPKREKAKKHEPKKESNEEQKKGKDNKEMTKEDKEESGY